MNAQTKFPAGTILAEMKIDIYASKKRDDLWIMHDRPFDKEVTALEFEEENSNLVFIFGEERKSLGAPLRKALVNKIRLVEQIALYQMDFETKQPLAAVMLPLTVKPAPTKKKGSMLDTLTKRFEGHKEEKDAL